MGTLTVMAEQIYGCSFWLINYHLPYGGAIFLLLDAPRLTQFLDSCASERMHGRRRDRQGPPALQNIPKARILELPNLGGS